MGGLIYQLLGPLTVTDGSGPVELPGGKASALLTILAVNANAAVSVDRLTEALWPDSPPQSPIANLQVYVSNLRRALGTDDIQRERAGYVLRVDPDQLDLTRFEALAARGRAATDPHQRATILGDALALWRGPALPEVRDEPWAVGAVTRWEEARLAVIEDRVEADMALGQHDQLIAELRSLVIDQPFRERLVGQLMVALYRAGRQAEALRAYERLRRDLADQLGIAPSPALSALDLQILEQRETLEWIPATTANPPVDDLVGRSSELETLGEAYDTARNGEARLVVIAGEPGVGKTRLARAAAAAAERAGATVLWGAGFEGGWFRPYGPFGEALESYVSRAGLDALGPVADVLTPLLPGGTVAPAAGQDIGEQRVHVYDALVHWLRTMTSEGPVVLVLDDLQWVDRTNIELVRYLTRALAHHPLLIICAYRDTEAVDEELRRLASPETSIEVHLGGLPERAIADLARRRGVAPAMAGAIAVATGGNPFFVREVLDHLAAPAADTGSAEVSQYVRQYLKPGGQPPAEEPVIPTTDDVRRMIGARVDALSTAARQLVVVASVVGMTFDLGLAARAASLTVPDAVDAIEEALRARLVLPAGTPDAYRFAGALVHDVLYEQLSSSRRLRAHRAIADAQGDEQPAELARHYFESKELPDAQRGVEPATRAAAHAEAAGAHREAAAMLEIALALLPAGDDRRAALLVRWAAALSWSLEFDRAAAAAIEAATLLPPTEGAAVLAEAATVVSQAGSARQARAIAEEGLTRITDAGNVTWALLTLISLRPDDLARPERREAARLVKSDSNVAPRFGFLYGALESVYESRQEVLDDPAPTATALIDRAGVLDVAAEWFARDAEESERSGRLAWAACCWAETARARNALGYIDEANGLVVHATDLASRVGPRGWLNGVLLGAADEINMAVDGDAGLAFQAQPPELRSRVMQISDGIGNGVLPAAYARTMARLGDTDAALESLASVIDAIERTPGWVLALHRVASDAAETIWYLDRTDHLEVIQRALREKVLTGDFRRSMMDVRHALGRLSGLEGRIDEAQDWWGQARRVLEEQGARPLRAVVDFDEALLWSRRGEGSRARELATVALDAFAALGLKGWVTKVTELRARLA